MMQRISLDLLDKLEALRAAVGVPLTVTSGFRCAAYQAHLRGVLPPGHTATGTSTHERGDAADIMCSQLTHLKLLAPTFFMAIGDAPTFIHVDIRNDKRRAWPYL